MINVPLSGKYCATPKKEDVLSILNIAVTGSCLVTWHLAGNCLVAVKFVEVVCSIPMLLPDYCIQLPVQYQWSQCYGQCRGKTLCKIVEQELELALQWCLYDVLCNLAFQ